MNEPKAHHSGAGKGAKALIYVVDDEPMLLELACVVLEPLGYAIKTFRDPETAIQALTETQSPPALIITDYAMHAMTGLDLLKACRGLLPRQKVLLVSATVDEHVYRDSPVKPDRFLSKPYQAKQLVEIVQSLIGH